MGGPFDFIVSQSPNLWIFRFETLDLDFWLDNNKILIDTIRSSPKMEKL